MNELEFEASVKEFALRVLKLVVRQHQELAFGNSAILTLRERKYRRAQSRAPSSAFAKTPGLGDVNAQQRGVEGRMKIEDVRCNLKSVDPKIRS